MIAKGGFVHVVFALIKRIAIVLCAGIYYLIKEKNDPESKKIYSVISAVGAIVSVVCILLLIL